MGRKKSAAGTSAQVASLAGVSQSTVSMILNRKSNVSFSKETIEKVETAARKLNYVLPQKKVRSRKKGERLLVVFCPNLTNPYYVMLLQGIESRAREQGFGLFVCNTQRDLKMEERYLKMVRSLKPQGVIYTCNPGSGFMGAVELLSREIPIAIINNQNEKMKVDAVELDNTKLGRIMARHLLKLGHHQVAYIAPPLTLRQKQRSKRVEGFLAEYEKAGWKEGVTVKAAKEEADRKMPDIDSEYQIGYQLTKELLAEKEKVTAIVGLNDMIAFGILDALYEAKIKVPQEVSVMGCDNTLFARMSKVDLTTIEHFVVFKGRDACDIIMKKMESHYRETSQPEPISTYHVEYEPRLIVRGTTANAYTGKKNKH